MNPKTSSENRFQSSLLCIYIAPLSFARGINSTYQFRRVTFRLFTLFLKLGSHYNIVPLSFARGIIQLAGITALRLWSTSVRSRRLFSKARHPVTG
jgi:hypothetical protein